MLVAACITALSEDPQTMLIVTHDVETGNPAPRATCRAGACPMPACKTCPMSTSSTMPEDGLMSIRPSNSLTDATPKSTALIDESAPINRPIGVLETPQMTAVCRPMSLGNEATS